MEILTSKTLYHAEKLKGIIEKKGLLSQVEFDECTFIKCSFQETRFEGCIFHNCVFQNCDLSLVNLKNCKFTQTRFEKSQLLGVDWTETLKTKVNFLKSVDFDGCVISHSTFTALNLKQIQISHCTAHDVDFSDANLAQADCTYTDFANTRFNHTDLTEADFTGASNYSIAASFNTLKKTRFSLPEAMSLLRDLDIILTEESMDEDDSGK